MISPSIIPVIVRLRRTRRPSGPALLLALPAIFCFCIPIPSPCAAELPAPEMVLIRPGAFLMGSPETEPMSAVDELRHEVTITRPFRLAATEVTAELWAAVTGDEPGYFPRGEGIPVESVSWYDAVAFCNALSREHGIEPAYRIDGDDVAWDRDATGYRLPTEAEWEYACRAGTRTAYADGDCLSTDRANYDGYHPLPGCPEGMNRAEPVPVAGFAPNPWGLHDMAGNVAEWCWDRFGDYAPGAAVDPAGPEEGELRVIRGGSWANFGAKCRSANRERNRPDGAWDMVGLRLARNATGEGGGP